MARPLRIGFFGLPLGALLLSGDGHQLQWAVLSPIPQPGRRRLARLLPAIRRFDLYSPFSGSDSESKLPSTCDAGLIDAGPIDAGPIDAGPIDAGTSWQKTVSELLAAHPVDLIVSWYFTRRIRAEWIECAPLGAIGVHPSLLPKYRGPDPFYAVIDAGELVTGVTVHRLTAEYDKGAMLEQRTLEVGERNAWQLARALDRPSLAAIRHVTRAFAEGRPPQAQEQNETAATYAPQPDGEALRANFSWPTNRVMRRIRALGPVPGLGIEVFGVPLLVCEAIPCDDFPKALLPGEAYIGPRLVIRTGDGAISVEKAALDAVQVDSAQGGETEGDPSGDQEPITYSGADLAIILSQAREKLHAI